MHTIERQLIDYGAIDTWITSLEVDSWFDKVIIKFNGKNDFGTITCEFFGCYQINLNHDRTYSKCKKIMVIVTTSILFRILELIAGGDDGKVRKLRVRRLLKRNYEYTV